MYAYRRLGLAPATVGPNSQLSTCPFWDWLYFRHQIRRPSSSLFDILTLSSTSNYIPRSILTVHTA